jgi:hypothetical protein
VRSRSFALVILAVLGGLGAAAYSAWDANSFQSQLLQDSQAGRNVVEISSANPVRPVAISRASCDALSKLSSVSRSGLLEPEGTFSYPGIGADISTFAASSTLFPTLQRNDLLVGDELKRARGSFRALMPNGSTAKASVNPPQPAGIDVNSSVVTAIGPLVISGPTCVVDFSAYTSANMMTPVLMSELVATGGPLEAQSEYTSTANPVSAFLARPGQFLPLLIGIFGGLAAGVVNRLRGSEFATYRLSGTSARSLAIIVTLEQVSLSGVFVAAAVGGSTVLSRYGGLGYATGLFELAAGGAWIVFAVAACMDVVFRRPVKLANER